MPGWASWVGRAGWVGYCLGVLVGGNQRMVAVGVPVGSTGEGVVVGKAGRSVQAAGKVAQASNSKPRMRRRLKPALRFLCMDKIVIFIRAKFLG
jgi:predicted RNA-binding protein YlqC (UPF0109 family)